jgi:hypothetical protein
MPLGRRHDRTVYGLASSEDGVVRYVGSTTQPPAARLANHVAQAARDAAAPVHRWIHRVTRSRRHRIIAVVLMEHACVWCESAEIGRRLAAGEPLLNVRAGLGRANNYRAHLLAPVPLSKMPPLTLRGVLRTQGKGRVPPNGGYKITGIVPGRAEVVRPGGARAGAVCFDAQSARWRAVSVRGYQFPGRHFLRSDAVAALAKRDASLRGPMKRLLRMRATT